MCRRIPVLFAVLTLGLMVLVLAPACRKLPERAAAVLPAETLASPSTVPAAWGDLVAVSSTAEYPDLVQLWFQDNQKNVRRVVMRVRTGELLNAYVVRRN